MEDWEQRLDYLEETNDMLLMQNRVLAAALQGFLRAMPQEMAENIVASVQAAFEDEVAELGYSNSVHADLFQEAVDAFFRDKRQILPDFAKRLLAFISLRQSCPFVQIFDWGTKGYAAAQRARLKTQI